MTLPSLHWLKYKQWSVSGCCPVVRILSLILSDKIITKIYFTTVVIAVLVHLIFKGQKVWLSPQLPFCRRRAPACKNIKCNFTWTLIDELIIRRPGSCFLSRHCAYFLFLNIKRNRNLLGKHVKLTISKGICLYSNCNRYLTVNVVFLVGNELPK